MHCEFSLVQIVHASVCMPVCVNFYLNCSVSTSRYEKTILVLTSLYCAGSGTGTIGNNGSCLVSMSQSSVNISA